MSQSYETRVGDEFVIVGNDVLMKCDIPSFAADLLSVSAWRTEPDGQEITSGGLDMDDGDFSFFKGRL